MIDPKAVPLVATAYAGIESRTIVPTARSVFILHLNLASVAESRSNHHEVRYSMSVAASAIRRAWRPVLPSPFHLTAL
jgi:hypothetical protein